MREICCAALVRRRSVADRRPRGLGDGRGVVLGRSEYIAASGAPAERMHRIAHMRVFEWDTHVAQGDNAVRVSSRKRMDWL